MQIEAHLIDHLLKISTNNLPLTQPSGSELISYETLRFTHTAYSVICFQRMQMIKHTHKLPYRPIS